MRMEAFSRCGGVLLLAAMLGLSVPAQAGEVVREFNGSRSTDTPEFEVRAPWILDWRVVGEYPRTMAVEVSLVEAGSGVHVGNVLRTKWPGNGVRLFDEGGRYHFQVISNLAEWSLKVEQLSPEEAEAYTPR
ncbi:MAG: hypothetical protein R3348_00790 [Xanthomonadales bacterium]|nr:hypothetical protein [Xanthomonadales bacterium]